MFRKQRTHSDFSAEIQAHIALETDRLIAEGMSPQDARAAAVRRFGNAASVAERFYESRRILWTDHLLQDARYALRGFRKTPSFTAVAVLTLALGIGANTAIFSVLKAVVLEPLPFRDPGQFLHVTQTLPAIRTIDARPRRLISMELEEFLELRKHTHTLASLAAYDTNREVTMSGRDEPIRVVGTAVSASLFPTLGVQPALGRNFLPEEEQSDAQTIILSHAAWRKHFGQILNRTLTIDGGTYVVVGVMQRGFEFPRRLTEFWMPLNLSPPLRGDVRSVIPLGRLQNGVTAEAAASEANTIVDNFRRTYPPDRAITYDKLELTTIKDELVRPVQSALVVLTIAVGYGRCPPRGRSFHQYAPPTLPQP